MAMYDEITQFTISDIWRLVSKPNDHHIVGIKWLVKNKLDECGNIIRNVGRLVPKGITKLRLQILMKLT